MLFSKANTTTTTLQDLINDIQSKMLGLDPTSPEHKDLLDKLERLYKLQAPDKAKKSISTDALLAVAGNLLGIGLILGFEKGGMIFNTKALGFVTKTRI